LRRAIAEAAVSPPPVVSPTLPDAFEREVTSLSADLKDVPAFLVRRLLLDIGGYTESRLSSRHPKLSSRLSAARERLAIEGCRVPEIEARTRYDWIREVTGGCIQRPSVRPTTWTDRLDRVLTHRVWGTLVFLTVMFLVFQSIFTWAAPLMELIDAGKGAIGNTVGSWIAPGPLHGLVVNGIIDGVGSVLMFLPQILILFAFIAILEDCGYMARAAFLMDKVMAGCGLSGKSFIPMLSSVACAVPGIMATRVIDDRRDRLTTILVAPLMSCSARLPVYVLLIGAFFTANYPTWVPGVVMFSMYALGIVVAPLVALLLKRTLLRGETPVFIMEMPLYRWPSPQSIIRRVTDSAWAFVRRAGTLILASMIVVWALLYFPHTAATGESYDVQIAQQQEELDAQTEELKVSQRSKNDTRVAELESEIDGSQSKIEQLQAEWKSQSILGRIGKGMEPVFEPLGWDWRVGMAALASFPAREVVIGTLSVIYATGDSEEDVPPGQTRLGRALQDATWDGEPDRKVFTAPVALSLMVFFALCCQCVSTLAVIRRETNSWRWPIFTFVYMTVLAYAGAFTVYQLGSLVG
jgi:ferrous iron transport protein B